MTMFGIGYTLQLRAAGVKCSCIQRTILLVTGRKSSERASSVIAGRTSMGTEANPKTLFLNGVEVESIEPTGNSAKDLAAARRFLAEKGIDKPQQRLTVRDKLRRVWRSKFL
jgi:hypothetical protein